MALKEEYFDKFSNEAKLKNEQKRLIKLFEEIETKMKDLSRQGIDISLAGSIREVEATVKSLERTAAELSVVRKEYAITASKVIKLKEEETRATKELTLENVRAKQAQKERNRELVLQANYMNAAKGSIQEHLAQIAILENNLKKLDLTKSEDLIIQDSINKKIKEYNALIAAQGGKQVKQQQDPIDQTQPQDVPFTHNLDELEEQNKLLEKQGDIINQNDKNQLDAQLSAEKWAESQRKVAEETEKTVDGKVTEGVKEYKDELERLSGSLTENEELLRLNKKELASVTKEMDDMENNSSNAEKATARYQKRMEELRRTETALKKEVKELNALTKAQYIENTATAGSVEKLTSRLQIMTFVYNKMGVEFQKSAAGKAMAKEMVSIDQSVQRLKKSSGQIHETTSNMSNAVTRSLGRALGVIRNLAYLIPGIGIGGLIGLILQPIINLFDRTDKEAEELTEKLKTLIKTSADIKTVAIAGTDSEIIKVEKLASVVTDQTKSYKERNRALEELKTINKDYFGDLTIEKAQLGLLTIAVKEYTDALIANEVVKAFGSQIGEVSVELAKQLSIVNKANNEAQKFRNQMNGLVETYEEMVKNSKAFNKETGEVQGFRTLREAALGSMPDIVLEKYDSLNRKMTAAERTAHLSSGAYLELGKNLRELKDSFSAAVDEALKFKPLTTKGAGDGLDDRIKNYDRALKKLRDSYLEIAKDETRNIKDRTDAREEAFKIDTLLIEQKRKIDVHNARGNAREIADINEDAADTQILIERDKINDILKMQQKWMEDLRENASKGGEIATKGLELINKDLKDIYEDRLKILDAQNDQELKAIENNYQEQLNLLDAKFAAGKISEKKYAREKLKLEAQLQAESLKQQIDYLEKVIQIEEILNSLEKDEEVKQQRASEIDLAKEKLKGLQLALTAIALKLKKDMKKLLGDDFVDIFANLAALAQTAFDTIAGLANASAEREKNRIQEEIDLLDLKAEKEAQVIEQTITNERDKAAALEALETRTNQQRRVYEIQQRQAEERAARFQKASTIASITLATALAVIKAFTEGDPATKILRAIAAAATGAAQLAVAIATPVPKYATGGIAKKGLGIAGEKGRELAVDKHGNLTLYDKPTLTSFVGGEKIYPNKVTEDILASIDGAKININNSKQKEQDNKSNEILGELKRLNKKPPVVVAVSEGMEAKPYYVKHMKGHI